MKNFLLALALVCLPVLLPGQNPCTDLDNPPGCRLCSLNFTGSTDGFTPDDKPYDFPCGVVENSQWHSIQTDNSGFLEISLFVSACSFGKGVEGMIYDENYQPVSDCFSTDEFLIGNTTVENLIPNTTYFILLDGIDGDLCDFLLQIKGAVDFSKDEPTVFGIPPTTIVQCQEEECFSIIRPAFSDMLYEWEIPNGAVLISGGTPQDTFVCLRFPRATGGTLTITPKTSCGVGQPIERNVFVVPDNSIIVDTTICPGTCLPFGNDCLTQSRNVFVQVPCGTISRVNISFADTSDFEIKCLIDSFTNSLAFDWKNLGADSFDIFIDDNFQGKQPNSSFLLPLSSVSGSEVKLRVVPSSNLGCQFKSSELICAVPSTLNTSDFNFEDIKIFPNPTLGLVEIKTSEKIEKVSVFDFSGKLILQSVDPQIDLSGYDSGIYFLKINTLKKSKFAKIFVL